MIYLFFTFINSDNVVVKGKADALPDLNLLSINLLKSVHFLLTIYNVVKLDNYYTSEELENALEKFVYTSNNERYHESLQNLTPADVYYGRGEQILQERKKLKKQAVMQRRNEYLKFKKLTNQIKQLTLN